VWTLPTQHIESRSNPLEGVSLAELHQMLVQQPALLGTASIGVPNRGNLLNGVQLPASPSLTVVSAEHAWGTPDLIACLQRSVDAVQDQFPDTPPLYVGDLSQPEGGYLRGHRSHQSGLDADIGYYYRDEAAWYTKADSRNLDVARTWALVRALVSDCDIEYVFIDLRIQVLLREHAVQIGEVPEWLDTLFAKGPRKTGIIRHAHGHQTHIHLRIWDDRAQVIGEHVHLAKMWARMRQPSAWAR
jgi:murein endopeptidase